LGGIGSGERRALAFERLPDLFGLNTTEKVGRVERPNAEIECSSSFTAPKRYLLQSGSERHGQQLPKPHDFRSGFVRAEYDMDRQIIALIALNRELSHLFEAPSIAEARKRLKQLKSGLGTQVPEAIECFETGFVDATQFYAFPKCPSGGPRLERRHG
jgi:hypothetical protein